MKLNKFSDLVSENLHRYLSENGKDLPDGESEFEYGKYQTICETYQIKTQETSRALNLAIGSYSLITLPNIVNVLEKQLKYYKDYFANYLSNFFVNNPKNVLVVGLGNRHISADSLGAKVCGKVVVTRHLNESGVKVSAIVPSVLGLTGIESSDIVSAVCSKIKPDYVVVIDSLCASSVDRLGSSFQINNCPIIPGGGVGNGRKQISGFGAKLITIGVPLVVYGSTFVTSALGEVGISKHGLIKVKKSLTHSSDNKCILELIDRVMELREVNGDLIVTCKDIEVLTEKCADIIAYALNKILLGL